MQAAREIGRKPAVCYKVRERAPAEEAAGAAGGSFATAATRAAERLMKFGFAP